MSEPYIISHLNCLKSYSRLDEACAVVHYPKSLDELIKIFNKNSTRKITLRASGHSFHDQALGDDVVISLQYLNNVINLDHKEKTITVEPGVTWAQIVNESIKYNLIPAVVVSTSQTTAGGTLSADGISRYSPIFGSEKKYIIKFNLLIPGEQKIKEVINPIYGGDSYDGEIFDAVVGGFGFLGIVTSITYRLVNPPQGLSPQLRVLTQIKTVTSPHDLVEKLIDVKKDSIESKTVFSIVLPNSRNFRAAIYYSQYSHSTLDLRPYIVFQPKNWLRIFIGILASFSWINKLATNIVWFFLRRQAKDRCPFINDFFDYTFFMDANITEKNILEKLRIGLPVIQQTYVVPVENSAAFIESSLKSLEENKLFPTLIDAFFLPEDSILLGSGSGIVFTFSFEGLRCKSTQLRVIEFVETLGKICFDFKGRVRLSKNLYINKEVFLKMYGHQMNKLLVLKNKLDPNNILYSSFFKRILELIKS